MDVIYDMPTWPLTALLLALMFVANEAGYRTGRRRRDEPEDSRGVANGLKGSVFALVAFLLGFAFSMSSNRHDFRRKMVLDEANAVGTFYLRAGLIDDASGREIRDDLRQFVAARLEYFDKGWSAADRDRLGAMMERLLADSWTAVEQAARANPEATRTSQVVPAANAVIDLNATRAWAAGNHLPSSVVLLLTFAVVVSSLLAGHSSGQAGRRHVGLWCAFNVLFTLVLFVVLDFDRPSRGLVRVDHSPFVDLQRSIAEGR